MKKIIYHYTNPNVACQDGIAAAKAAFDKYPDAQLIGWMYQDTKLTVEEMDLPDVQPGDELYIVDFSFTKEVLDIWATKGCQITVIDHHKGAWRMLQGFTAGILKFDMLQCGAVLAYRHFNPSKPVPAIYQYVQNQDLWKFKLPNAEAVCAAIYPARTGYLNIKLPQIPIWKRIYLRFKYAYLTKKERQSFLFFDALENKTLPEIEAIFKAPGEAELEIRNKKVEKLADRAEFRDVLGHNVPCVEFLNQEEYALRSHTLHYLTNKFLSAEFASGFILKGNTQYWTISTRDDSDFDCELLCSSAGGGGHSKVGGWSVKV